MPLRTSFLLCSLLAIVGSRAEFSHAQTPPQVKKPQVGPAAPQSTHYPILLEPSDVGREGTTDAWTYHAKDSQTGASVTVHLIREACTDTVSATTKFSFR